MTTSHKVYERVLPRSTQGAATIPQISGAPQPGVAQRGITIHGWDLCVSRGTIADAAHVDAMGDRLGIPLPEMPFPHNSLTISHEASGFVYVLDGTRALQAVQGVREESHLQGLDVRAQKASAKGTKTLGHKPTGKKIKVSYAEQWGKKRDNIPVTTATAESLSSSPSSHFGPEVAAAAAASGITPGREYDWTYSTTWPGTTQATGPPDLFVDSDFPLPPVSSSSSASPASFEPAKDPHVDRIPVEKLGAGPNAEPILFYDDLVLFEDELADNGSSMLNVKIRVMPSSFLILQRFFLRVDDVVFRCFDVRLFCDFFPNRTAAPTDVPLSRPDGHSESTTGAPWNTTQASSASVSEAIAKGFSSLSLGPTRRELQAIKRVEPAATVATPSSASHPRLIHTDCGELKIIRECVGYESSYKEVRERLPAWKPHDLSPLTDPNWVVSTLRSLAAKRLGRAVAEGAPHPTLSPARVPLLEERNGAIIGKAAQIVGEVDDTETEGDWEGCGESTEVLIITPAAESIT